MNEQLSAVLVDILKTSKDGVINVALFAQQQAPELAKEIIQWGFWSNLFWVILSPVVFFISYKLFLYGIKMDNDGNCDGAMFCKILCWILVVIFIVTFCCSLQEMIKCLVAPKIYIIDYVKNLIQPASK